jgi:MtN3 and saliva related transmembrane protein
MQVEILGWVSSAILVLTIARQIYKQWHEDSSKAVSLWLFLGQFAASAGFLVYSIALRNGVFVVTNAVLMVSALVGAGLVLVHRRRRLSERRGEGRGEEEEGEGRAAREGGYDPSKSVLART